MKLLLMLTLSILLSGSVFIEPVPHVDAVFESNVSQVEYGTMFTRKVTITTDAQTWQAFDVTISLDQYEHVTYAYGSGASCVPYEFGYQCTLFTIQTIPAHITLELVAIPQAGHCPAKEYNAKDTALFGYPYPAPRFSTVKFISERCNQWFPLMRI